MTRPPGDREGGATPRGTPPPPSGAGALAPDAPAVGAEGAPVPEARRRRDAALAREGWTRRFTGGPPNLGDLQELYESAGQEVLLDEVLPGELARECEGCALALSLFRVVYTRPARRGPTDPGANP